MFRKIWRAHRMPHRITRSGPIEQGLGRGVGVGVRVWACVGGRLGGETREVVLAGELGSVGLKEKKKVLERIYKSVCITL